MQDQTLIIAISCVAVALAIVAIIVFSKWRSAERARVDQERRLAAIEDKYRPILNIEKAVTEAEKRLADTKSAFHTEKAALDQAVVALKADYAAKKAVYDRLSHEIASLENRVDLAELGIYQPVFHFDDSAQYAAAIEANIAKQKITISAGNAVISETKWTVDGSEAKGRTMTNRAIRMTLRAFNNECEVIISKVSWKNFSQMAERIRKSQKTLDKLNESSRLRISEMFVDLKLEELRLSYEEHLKKHEEQEKLREEREREREEAKAQRELEAELRRATRKEEERREALMEARAELRAAGEAERAALGGQDLRP
jgi:hypothetical protein